MNTRISKAESTLVSEFAGATKLLVLQATPTCNLNCTYCYLPNRRDRGLMSPDVLQCVFQRILGSAIVADSLNILWHSGEPLVAPRKWYANALRICARHNPRGIRIKNDLQTNGVLLNGEWCEFFRANDFRIGVSLDGPQHLHDNNRVTWSGNGSYAHALRGLRLLQEHEVDHHVLTVVTVEHLDHPDELFQFYLENSITHVGLNMEETTAVGHTSRLRPSHEEKAREFFSRLFELNACHGHAIRIREHANCVRYIRTRRAPIRADSEPMGILSVDVRGNTSTFSPELLGIQNKAYNNFVIGNVFTDAIADMVNSETFLAIRKEVEKGQRLCRERCEYFLTCGGGTPAAKMFEHKTFEVSETTRCRFNEQIVADAVLAELESLVRSSQPSTAPPKAV